MIRTEEVATGRVNGHITHAERPRGGMLLLPTITGVDAFARGRAQVLAEAGLHHADLEFLSGRGRRRPTCRRRRRAPPSSTTRRSTP